MPDTSLLEKYTGRRVADPDAPQSAPEVTDDLGCFGWLRGVKERSLMLQLRKRDSAVHAFGYSWIERMDFDPSEGITLYVPGHRIRVVGRHLNTEIRPGVRLYDGLTRHKVPWIAEAGEHEAILSLDTQTLVKSISLTM